MRAHVSEQCHRRQNTLIKATETDLLALCSHNRLLCVQMMSVSVRLSKWLNRYVHYAESEFLIAYPYLEIEMYAVYYLFIAINRV